MGPASTAVLGVVLLANVGQVVDSINVAPIESSGQFSLRDLTDLRGDNFSAGALLGDTSSGSVSDEASSKCDSSHSV